jgi:hypothetical protein
MCRLKWLEYRRWAGCGNQGTTKSREYKTIGGRKCIGGEFGDLLSVENYKESLVGHIKEIMGRGRGTRDNQQVVGSTRKIEEKDK